MTAWTNKIRRFSYGDRLVLLKVSRTGIDLYGHRRNVVGFHRYVARIDMPRPLQPIFCVAARQPIIPSMHLDHSLPTIAEDVKLTFVLQGVGDYQYYVLIDPTDHELVEVTY